MLKIKDNIFTFNEEENEYIGIGKPEPLKYGFSGYWSRRIDKYNRIVYKIENNILKIAQCGLHYNK